MYFCQCDVVSFVADPWRREWDSIQTKPRHQTQDLGIALYLLADDIA